MTLIDDRLAELRDLIADFPETLTVRQCEDTRDALDELLAFRVAPRADTAVAIRELEALHYDFQGHICRYKDATRLADPERVPFLTALAACVKKVEKRIAALRALPAPSDAAPAGLRELLGMLWSHVRQPLYRSPCERMGGPCYCFLCEMQPKVDTALAQPSRAASEPRLLSLLRQVYDDLCTARETWHDSSTGPATVPGEACELREVSSETWNALCEMFGSSRAASDVAATGAVEPETGCPVCGDEHCGSDHK